MYKRKDDHKTRNSKQLKLGYGLNEQPKAEHAGEVSDVIGVKAMKNLYKSTYSFAVDPYTNLLPPSDTYPIITKFNKVVGTSYLGDKNLDGGNVQQYPQSITSGFLKCFDVARMNIDVNYNFIPTKAGVGYGKQLINEQRKSTAEAISLLKSTTFTQLALNNLVVETDMNMGSASTTEYRVGTSQVKINCYDDPTDVFYAISRYYQIFLQEGLSTINALNSFRMKQGIAIRNAFGREVPNLNSFFGLMNKKSFLSMIDSINLSFEGEYVDKQWMQFMNVMTIMPSRRSNAMTDPILELTIKHDRPTKFKVYYVADKKELAVTDPVIDDSMFSATIPFGDSLSDISYWDACSLIKDYLSLEATQAWARKNYASGYISGTDDGRFNQIKFFFDVLVNSFTIFKPLMNDFREALDTMTRTGSVRWSKGFRPGITPDVNADPYWFLLVDNIYQLIFSGADKIALDNQTKRWRTFTLWNMYSGIPDYDRYSGGAFLSYSFKEYVTPNDNTELVEYLPVLFNYEQAPKAYFLSRDGKEVELSYKTEKISDNVVLARLAPLLSQNNETMRIPFISNAAVVHSNLSDMHISFLYRVLTQIFGIACIEKESEQLDYSVDPDLLAIYQIELADTTNESITYVRANSPFRGTTSESGILGFKVPGMI